MRTIPRYGVSLALVFCCLAASGQDIHFSQFNASPLFLNPAFTGVNSGNYRLVANYKAQWTQLAPYNTVAASFDMNILKKSERANFGGMGMMLYTDKAGDSELRTTQANLYLSYTVLLNKKGTQSISTGITGGVGHRSINTANLTWNAQWEEFQGYVDNPPNGETLAETKVVYPDIGAGILWNYVKKKQNLNVYLGGAVSHINMPSISFINDNREKLYIKAALHGGGHFRLSKQVFILPSFMYLNQGPHNQFNVGFLVKIKKSIMPKDKTSFYIGGWYRLKDALILNVRADVGNFNIGFSYDINLSGLTPASNANGGPELSLIYSGIFPKKKEHIIFCPPIL